MRFLLILIFFINIYAQKPNFFLLNVYKDDLNVTGWYMSEKLDGVRAYWDGKHLISRGGRIFNAPPFFTKDFPKNIYLDGELWSKRGEFSFISSIVNRKKAHNGWKNLTYNIFEVPNSDGNLTQRLSNIKSSKYLKIIKQIKIKNKNHLKTFFKHLVDNGAEGVVLRDGSLDYYTGRKDSALKLKKYFDDECVVIKHNLGNGKYKAMLGSLTCKLKNSKTIKIGTGFSNVVRQSPPKIGSVITFKYYGLTSNGNPRFPVFLRIRE